MSVDLAWDVLDDALAQSLLTALNRQLASVQRPSFVGPVEVAAFDFGTVPPELELVDLRDIYRDFLEADEQDEAEQQRLDTEIDEDEDGFEWVSRRSIPPDADGHGTGPAYHALPPHIRYGGPGGGPVTDMFSSLPSLRSPRDGFGGSPLSASMLDGFARRPMGTHSLGLSGASMPSSLGLHSPRPTQGPSSSSDSSLSSSMPPQSSRGPPSPPNTSSNPHPNLQMHMNVHWPSDLRLTLKTSLLINYPSPSFLALPIKLSVTGLVFDGEIAIAYEGARRRAHVCILDALDPYGPLANSRRTPLARTSTSSSLASDAGLSSNHPDDLRDDEEEDEENSEEEGEHGRRYHRSSSGSKPPPVGQRLLPTICIESEIGSADRHILKNVGRVERFVQDVLRKTVEDELVFPNFHTIVLGDA
jgi:distribution and morphology protein 12